MEKPFKVESNTGCVHLAYDAGFKDRELVHPYCNSMTWCGDYWGKRWKRVDKPVTCKNCLSKYHREISHEHT